MLSIPRRSVYNIQDNKIKQRSHLDLSATALKENRLYVTKYKKQHLDNILANGDCVGMNKNTFYIKRVKFVGNICKYKK